MFIEAHRSILVQDAALLPHLPSEAGAEDLLDHTLSEVPHRFWTFSIPKRLRPWASGVVGASMEIASTGIATFTCSRPIYGLWDIHSLLDVAEG